MHERVFKFKSYLTRQSREKLHFAFLYVNIFGA